MKDIKFKDKIAQGINDLFYKIGRASCRERV